MNRSSTSWFRLRKLVSAAIWLCLPLLVLVAPRGLSLEAYFRARPFNDSYDSMFIAAMAGIGFTSVWAVFMANHAKLIGSTIPASSSWLNAFDLFELAATALLAATNFAAGVAGAGVVWSLALVTLLALSFAVAREQRGLVLTSPPGRTIRAHTMSVLLVAFAMLFVAFPVLQSWSGPPEFFVRWHPFSVPAELIWRGVFLSFALGMFVAAFDPCGRHTLLLVALVLSGYLHSLEMLVNNLWSAQTGGMNGNHQHLYGDIAGWFTIASLSLLFLLLERWRRLPGRP